MSLFISQFRLPAVAVLQDVMPFSLSKGVCVPVGKGYQAKLRAC